MKKGQYIAIGISIPLLAAVGFSLYGYQLRTQKEEQVLQQEQERLQTIENAQEAVRQLFANLKLDAQAVYVQNLSTGAILYENNSSKVLPLASLTKIMTTLTALSHIDDSTGIIFSEAAVHQAGDQGFAVGEVRTLRELIPFMLVTSSNDAGYAIAETVEKNTGTSFTASMREQAKQLGFQSFAFDNPTGLDIESNGETSVSAHGSAADVAALLLYATQHYPEYFAQSAESYAELDAHVGANTNILTESVPGFLVSKTGYTNKARGNLAFIFEVGPNQPYMIVIMGSTFDGRFTDAKKIIKTLYTVVEEMPNAL